MQSLALLERICSCSAYRGVCQGVAEEKSLCDLMVLNGSKRLCAFAFRQGASQEQIPPAALSGCRWFLVILLHRGECREWLDGLVPFPGPEEFWSLMKAGHWPLI